jgi:hypothetical protein
MIVNIDPQTSVMSMPQTWGEVADRLGTSTPSLNQCRHALDRFQDPITSELVEDLRRMLRFCEMRNRGGGASCTRAEYVRIRQEEGEAALEARLRMFRII